MERADGLRSALAAVADGLLVALIGFLAFRFGLWAAPCDRHLDNCAILNPLIVLSVVLALGLYFGLGFGLWRSTPARQLFGVCPLQSNTDDHIPP